MFVSALLVCAYTANYWPGMDTAGLSGHDNEKISLPSLICLFCPPLFSPGLPRPHCTPVKEPEGLTNAWRQTDRQTDVPVFPNQRRTHADERDSHMQASKPCLCAQKKEIKGMHANALLLCDIGHQQTKEPIKQQKKNKKKTTRPTLGKKMGTYERNAYSRMSRRLETQRAVQ